jgi:hypothetical protein
VMSSNGATTPADHPEFDDRRRPDALGQVVPDDEADFLLDALLKVEEVDLEVEGLSARVSVQAEVADLVKLAVSADVNIEKLKMTLEGVDVQALLKVRLDQIRTILDKALTTLGEHPEILLSVLSTDTASGEAGGAVHEGEGQGGALTAGTGEVAGQANGQGGQVADQAPGRAADEVGLLREGTAEDAERPVEPVDDPVKVVERTTAVPRRSNRRHWHPS